MDALQNYQIRDFQLKDTYPIVELAERLVEESVNFHGPVDRNGIVQELLYGFNNRAIILIAESEKEVVGVLAATLGKVFFLHEEYYEERVFFVRRDFRKSKVAKDLLMEYVRRVRNSGVPKASIGVGTGLRPKSLVRLYRSFGFSEMCYIASRRF